MFMRFGLRFSLLLSSLALLSAQPAHAQLAQSAPTAPTFQAASKLLSLQQRLAAMANENPGDFGIAAMDLETGHSVAFNGGKAFPMASTMKIAVAATYLAEVDAGRRTLSDTIGSSNAFALMDAMMTRSDNHATDALIATLGGPAAIDRWLHAHNLSGMRVDRNIAQLLSAKRDLWDVRDSSTPTAMLGLLRVINGGEALTARSRSLLLDMMYRCRTGSNRIRGILPAGARVENKTGTLNGYTGDVGYLTTPTGKRIAVAFFGRGGENRPAVIATAARMIYDAFESAPAAPRPAASMPTRIASATTAPKPVAQSTAMTNPTAAPATPKATPTTSPAQAIHPSRQVRPLFTVDLPPSEVESAR